MEEKNEEFFDDLEDSDSSSETLDDEFEVQLPVQPCSTCLNCDVSCSFIDPSFALLSDGRSNSHFWWNFARRWDAGKR